MLPRHARLAARTQLLALYAASVVVYADMYITPPVHPAESHPRSQSDIIDSRRADHEPPASPG